MVLSFLYSSSGTFFPTWNVRFWHLAYFRRAQDPPSQPPQFRLQACAHHCKCLTNVSPGTSLVCNLHKLNFLTHPALDKMVDILQTTFSLFLAATKQLYDWFSPSVRPSVCLSVRPSVRLSVCHTFFTMFPSSYHHVIFRSYYHGQKWCPCKRSRSEVKGQGHRGQHPT